MPDWLIPSRVYDILKWLGLIVLPALALFVGTVGPAWGWTHVDAIVTTLNALGILAGALIGVSAIKQRLDRAARITTHSSAPPGIADSSHKLDCTAGRDLFRVVAEGFAGSIFAHILPTFSVKNRLKTVATS